MTLLSRYSLISVLAVALLTGACTMHIETPPIEPMDLVPSLSETRLVKLAAIDLKTEQPVLDDIQIPPIDRSVHLPRTGEKTAFGLTVTPELEKLWRATGDKDWQYWVERLDEAEASLPDTPKAKFFLQSLRIQTMIHSGRVDDVFLALKTFGDMEFKLFGDNSETLSQYGQVYFWLGQPDKAIGYYAQLLADAGDWWVPDFYYAPIENIGTVTRLSKAMIRAYIGMSGAYLMKHDYAKAVHWGQRGLRRHQQVIGLTQHPIYGLVVKADAHLYEGHGWLLTFLGAARIGLTKDVESSRYILEAAQAYFAQGGYRWSDLVVQSVRDFALYDVGLKSQDTDLIGELPDPTPVSADRLRQAIRIRPASLETREEIALPVPASHTIALPSAGETNSFNFKVSPTLATVNKHFLAGEYSAALAELDTAEAEEQDPLKRWFVAYSRVRTMIVAGRAADAVAELAGLETLEVAYFGTNLATRSLRGEAKFWLGDYEAAIRDELQVVEALKGFRAPALFVFPPQIPQLALMNRAQFRAYLVIANSLMFQGEYARALPWAEAAEQLFEESHYSWQHQLYSAYLKIDRDMFYGRGLNLSIIAAAKLKQSKDLVQAAETFEAARAYLLAMGYEAGTSFVEAIRARALLDIDRPDLAADVAGAAAAEATRLGLAGTLWQLQALQGEALLALGKKQLAENAYRAAQAGIDAVSGALSTDGAKRRFGVGKDQVTQALVRLDLERNDLTQAFADLERGRARAFVDMLGGQRFASARDGDMLRKIRATSSEVRRRRAINAAPGMHSANAATEISQLLEKRSALLGQLRSRAPELADALSVSEQNLKAVQSKLGRSDRLLYALPVSDPKENLRFLDVRQRAVSLVEVGLTADGLEHELIPFATDDPLGQAERQRTAAGVVTSGLKLDQRQRQGVLYVVPTGPLYFVPWGALDVNRPVVVLPTGAWLTRPRGGLRTKRSATVVGDPQLGADWVMLPGAREEAERVGRLYNADTLMGANATEAAIRKSIGSGVQVLHLATHGLFDARDPLASAILVSGPDGPSSITAARLFEAPLKAELVVLSACETGLGHATAGDDFLGLARSFYLGGARAVMNSLWPVHDKPTRTFMIVFHEKARNGNFGQAWLAARDKLKAAGLPPSIYGAFVLGGAARI
jgi:hypothetical protein